MLGNKLSGKGAKEQIEEEEKSEEAEEKEKEQLRIYRGDI
jgi:hypothetical protein